MRRLLQLEHDASLGLDLVDPIAFLKRNHGAELRLGELRGLSFLAISEGQSHLPWPIGDRWFAGGNQWLSTRPLSVDGQLPLCRLFSARLKIVLWISQ